MRQLLLFLTGIVMSVASFAISPITGSTTTCVGWSATLSDATTGGTWSSSNPAIATVGATTGSVTGVASGVCTITYTVGSSHATTSFTVNPMDVITGGSTVCVGSTLMLSGSPSGGSWTSGTPSLATVSSTGVVTGIATGGPINIYYTGGGCYAYQAVTIGPALSSITGSLTTTVGGTSTLSDATPGGSWSSSNPSVATVGSTGSVTGMAAGTCTITYTSAGCYATASFTVTAASCAPITGSSSGCVGTTATLSDATPGGTWSSSNTSVATITSSGIVHCLAAGTTTITYTVGSSHATLTFTVNSSPVITGPSTVCIGSSITLSCSTPGGTWTSCGCSHATVSSSGMVTGTSAGVETVTYTVGGCYGTYSVTVNAAPTISGPTTVCSGSTITLTCGTPGGTWSSCSCGHATVSSSGVVTGVSGGVETITYTVGGCYATHPVTVNAPVITGTSTVCVGSAVTLSCSIPGGTWSSCSCGHGTVSSSGIVTGISAGVETVTYTVGGCHATYPVTVTAAPTITGGVSSLCVGNTTSLTGSPSGGSWTSGSPGVATVSSTGVVTAVAGGVVNIYYTNGCYTYRTITVNPTSSISGPSTVCTGSTITLTSSSPGGTWSTCSCGHATVSPSGVVTGISAGVETITYTLGTCFSTYSVTVSHSPVITGPSTVCVGSGITLTCSAPGGTWSSCSCGHATVSSGGIVTGVSAGVETITYTVGGCYGIYTVTVNTAPAITGPTTVCIGSTITLSGSAPGGTWSSCSCGHATVSSAGVVSGVSAGVETITYTVGACYATYSVTVSTGPAITGTATVCIGSTTALSCSTPGGTWSSCSCGHGTVSSTGVVTGISAGVETITYSVGGCTSIYSVTVTAAPTITGGSSSMCVGGTMTLTGSPSGGSWTSGSPGLATVSSSGVVTALASGVVNIYYTNGCYTYRSITINATPATISGPTTVCIGSSITLTASVPGGTWTSCGCSHATVSSTGVVTGVSAGVETVTYSLGGCFATYSVTVGTGPTISGPTTVCIGSSITLTSSSPGGTWTSCGCSHATVSSTGVVTGVSAGVETVTYSLGGCYATYAVTVHSSPAITGSSTVCTGSAITLIGSGPGGVWTSCGCSHASVSPAGVVSGISAGVETITYTIGGCYATHAVTVASLPAITGITSTTVGGSSLLSDATSGGTWSSSNSLVATVGTSTGMVSGVSSGSCTITYAAGGCSVTATFTVTSSIHCDPITGITTVCSASTTALSDATPGGVWSSSNPSVATVGSTGIVTGVSAGTADITYTVGSSYATTTVTVTAAPVITGISSICVGSVFTFTGTPSGGTWASSDPSRATISSSGFLTAINGGLVHISYTNGCTTVQDVTVNNILATISGPSDLCAGSSYTFIATAPGGTWFIDTTTVAIVNPASGVVNALSPGIAHIQYWLGGCASTNTLTVHTSPSAIVGGSYIYIDSIPETDSVPGGTWSSSNTAVVTIGANGYAHGVSIGSATITYTLGSCFATKHITVLAPGYSVVHGVVDSTAPGVSAPVAGMLIELLDPTTDALYAQTYTNPSGGYSFGSLPAGAYKVRPSAPGYTTVSSSTSVDGVSSNAVINFVKEGSSIHPVHTGIASLSGGSIKVYPNPTSGMLSITWSNLPAQPEEVIVSDATGREVFRNSISSTAGQSAQVDLSSVSNGLYLITVKVAGSYFANKISVIK